MRLDADSAECLVHTSKEGLLSAIAHDLEIRVTSFTIDVHDAAWQLAARFDPRSLRVVGASGPLSDGDKRTIEGNIVRDVLHADRFREISFTSDHATANGDEFRIAGTLTLHGTARPLTVTARRESGRWVAAARLHQPDFGIRPYTAMLGTLRVQADVTVRVVVSPR